MKKCFLNAVKVLAAVACAAIFASCVTSGAKGFDYYERGLDRSPENSVVFYMYFYGNQAMTYEQINPKYGEDSQTLTGFVLVSAPCEPGSYYHCSHVHGAESEGSYNAIWNQDIPEEFHGFDIKVPSEPGLYYVGFYDGHKSIETGSYFDMEDVSFVVGLPKGDLKKKKFLLNYVKKAYDGTPWAVLATEEQENINATLKNK